MGGEGWGWKWERVEMMDGSGMCVWSSSSPCTNSTWLNICYIRDMCDYNCVMSTSDSPPPPSSSTCLGSRLGKSSHRLALLTRCCCSWPCVGGVTRDAAISASHYNTPGSRVIDRLTAGLPRSRPMWVSCCHLSGGSASYGSASILPPGPCCMRRRHTRWDA